MSTTFWRLRSIFVLVVGLVCSSPAVAQLPSELKASNQVTAKAFQERAKKDQEKNGPIPYPPGYTVAFADKGDTKKNSLAVQKPVYGDEAIRIVERHPGMVIIDLRLPEEFADEHIPGAVNVSFVQPNQGFIRQLAKLDPTNTTLLYCDTGGETAKARLGFGVFGFKDLYALRDGLRGWKAAGGKTAGPQQGLNVSLDMLPEVVEPKLPPTPHAAAPEDASDGPFPTIPVSYDFAFAKDFAFDGRGHISSKVVTYYLRKRADVVGIPFRTIPEARYPKENVKRSEGIRVHVADSWRDEAVRYRADGDLLRSLASARGKPPHLLAMREGEGKTVDTKLVEGRGVLGLYTDIFNNVWFTGAKATQSPYPALNFLSPDNQHIELYKEGVLKMPWGIVHDARRGLLFYSEPLEKQIWVLPVDKQGKNVGTPRKIIQLENSEPWGITLDEFGNLYAAAEPDVLRFRLDAAGNPLGDPIKLNQSPIPRAHQIQFGNGPGFSETSLYVLSTQQTWTIVADALTGYVTGTFRPDGSVSRQLNNVPAYMSPLVRLDLGVQGAAEAMIRIPHPAPDTLGNRAAAASVVTEKPRGAF